MIRLLCCLVFLSIATARAGMREWKSADGTRTLVAEYVESENGHVTIRRQSDERTFTMKVTELSGADQAWILEREKAAAAPSPTGESPVPGGAAEAALVPDADPALADLLTGDWERAEAHGMKYRLYGDRKLRRSNGTGYPLVLFLHGKTMDVMTPSEPWAASAFSDAKNYRRRECFIVVPQCPDENGWARSTGDRVIEIVQDLVARLPVDQSRIYVTGWSMSGSGTFYMLSKMPELFAAGMPVCGGWNPAAADRFERIPVWAFHGSDDDIVPVDRTRAMVKALTAAGGHPKYTEYRGEGHGIEGRVYYQEDGVHEWLFEQKRSG